MIYHYTIPDIPPSNNLFIGRNNRHDYKKIKEKWETVVAVCCRPKPPKPLKRSIVTLVYHFRDNRRRDPDNYSGKMILDGLTKAGIIADDSFCRINLQLRAVYDKKGITEIFVEKL